jgi:hypothetical protein
MASAVLPEPAVMTIKRPEKDPEPAPDTVADTLPELISTPSQDEQLASVEEPSPSIVEPLEVSSLAEPIETPPVSAQDTETKDIAIPETDPQNPELMAQNEATPCLTQARQPDALTAFPDLDLEDPYQGEAPSTNDSESSQAWEAPEISAKDTPAEIQTPEPASMLVSETVSQTPPLSEPQDPVLSQPEAPPATVQPLVANSIEPDSIHPPDSIETLPGSLVEAAAQPAQELLGSVTATSPMQGMAEDFDTVLDSLLADLEEEEDAQDEIEASLLASLEPEETKKETATQAISRLMAAKGGTALTEDSSVTIGDYTAAFSTQQTTAQDWLLATALYLKEIHTTNRFNLKQINELLQDTQTSSVSHADLEQALTDGNVVLLPDLTGLANVTEYALTEAGILHVKARLS